jgi:terminase large subunit-like protein
MSEIAPITGKIRDRDNNRALQHLYQTEFPKSNEEEERLVRDCRGKTFLEFNKVIGLPRKNDKEYPIFDYEIDILRAFRNNQHIWIKKARGLGVTEITLRFLAWECLSTNRLQNKSIFIVSGTREEFANLLKERLADLFQRNYPDLQLESKYTELTLNKTWIKVFPTQQVKDLRGHVDVAYIFIDEADFFERIEQTELEAVISAYEEKSKAKIIMVSTPWLPDGLFQKIETGEIFKNTFYKMFLDYTKGLDRIYDNDFIMRKMNEPFFAAEYNLQYAGRIGNIFSQAAINRCTAALTDLRPNTEKVMAIDIGYVSSKFAIIIAELEPKIPPKGKIRILKAEEISNAEEPEMMERILQYYKEYKNIKNIAIDATSRQPFVSELKRRIGEYPYDWLSVHKKMQEYKSKKWDLNKAMVVVPVLFNMESKAIMTAHARQMIEDPRVLLAIDPKFKELLIALRAAIFDERGQLDKANTPHDDTADAFMMAMQLFQIRRKEK